MPDHTTLARNTTEAIRAFTSDRLAPYEYAQILHLIQVALVDAAKPFEAAPVITGLPESGLLVRTDEAAQYYGGFAVG